MSDERSEWPVVDTERVYELHEKALALAGGRAGVRDQGLVESAVSGARMAALYSSDTGEADPLALAAYLLCYLARDHAFIDGNKRVAWLAFEDQLRMVGLRVNASTDEAERLVLDVVVKHIEAADIIEWSTTRLDAYDP